MKVPGKLMIAGEFAVLEPYQKLAVMAVDRFVYASIQTSSYNSLTLENFHLSSLKWKFEDSTVVIDTEDERISFVKKAMQNTLTYLQEHHIQLDPFSLTIKSELDDVSGKKYGLGSSAAVVTSVVSAILNYFLPVKPSDTLIFKLASISHVKVQGNGSGADIAASTYGGMLEYASFQAEWLLEELETMSSLTELVEKKWTYFHVKPLPVSEKLKISIGWTGKPASTSKLVDKVLELKEYNLSSFEKFINESERAVRHFLEGMKTENIPLLLQGVKENRHALKAVGKAANAELETDQLKVLCDFAEAYGGAGKLSGAGGGDCGIAFMPSNKDIEALKKKWENADIQALDLSLYSKGASIK